MRVAVCDDDAVTRNQYAELIELIAEKERIPVVVDRFEKGDTLLFMMGGAEVPYDIIFLDIFMPGTDGISLGSQLKKENFIGAVIYLTRSEEHMFSAFDVGAANYVLKGEAFDNARFERVFKQAVREVERRKRKYILLNSITEHRNIAIDSILYFEVVRHVCFVYYGNNEVFEFASSLTKIEKTLAAFGFVRVHKSFLVNVAAVQSYVYNEVTMKNGAKIPLGRQRLAQFRKAMEALSVLDTSKEG